VTNGQGADSVILTPSLLRTKDIEDAVPAIRKGGTVVATAAARVDERELNIPLIELTMYQKRIQGVNYGMMSPVKDIPRLLNMWQAGQLRLEELVTRTYSLEQINDGYADMREGLNIRGVINFDQ